SPCRKRRVSTFGYPLDVTTTQLCVDAKVCRAILDLEPCTSLWNTVSFSTIRTKSRGRLRGHWRREEMGRYAGVSWLGGQEEVGEGRREDGKWTRPRDAATTRRSVREH